jgi:HlyD family secretion protein
VPNAALRVRITGVEPAAPAAATAAPAASAPAATPAASTGTGNALTEFRNRLVQELQLTPAQTEKVDAVYASARPKFMQLRELPEAERTKARERITADIRARIAELLNAEQKKRYAALQAEVAGRAITRGRIYVPGEGGKPKALSVRLGITDGSYTELIVSPSSPEAAELKEGASVITGVSGAAGGTARPGATGPRMMF